jgi:fructosamine-3-kinase
VSIALRVEEALGLSVKNVTSLSGGCVADVYRLALQDGDAVVAKSGNKNSGLALEGYMLDYLATHTDLPIPKVHYCEDGLLIMSSLACAGSLTNVSQVRAADLIAGLHDLSADSFGFEVDTVIGGLHQPNPKTPTWIDFFRESRLLYMAREALKTERLSPHTVARIEEFSATLDSYLLEPAAPSLIHGDLWGGNILCQDDEVTGFIDPAIYFAHAEIELAFGTLFSTFNQTFFRRYQEHRSIAPGFFEERLAIYNLYPLLVHVRLFGGHYVSQVEHTLARFGY